MALAHQETTSHLKGRLDVPSACMELTQAATLPQVAPAWLTAGVATARIVGGAVPTTMVAVLIATADAPVTGATAAGRLPATPFIRANVATGRMFAGVNPPKYATRS